MGMSDAEHSIRRPDFLIEIEAITTT